MEYFFLLVLEYEINGGWMRSRFILPNAAACQVAIRANEDLATSLNANLYCIETDVPSTIIERNTSPRPRLRPTDF